MPVVKSVTQAQWDAAARRLGALPEKPAHEHRVNVRDAMKSTQSQIIDAQRKGYTQDEIVQQIAQDGVEISASTLRYAVRHALEARQPVQADKDRVITATAKTNVRSPAKKAGQADITRNEMPSQAIEVATVSTPIRGIFEFPISPDTEDLQALEPSASPHAVLVTNFSVLTGFGIFPAASSSRKSAQH